VAAVLGGSAGVARPVHAQRMLTVVAGDTGLAASPTVPAGLTVLRLVLAGSARRDLVIRRIPAGTPAEEFAGGAAGRSEAWFSQSSFGGPAVPRDSESNASATVDLRPGRYALVSYEVDAAGRPRAARYFWRMVTAVATSVLIPARFEVPDITVKVRDSRIDVSGSARPGQRIIQVDNAGVRAHEIIIGRLKPGKTIADVQRWKRDKGDVAPFVYVGGVTPLGMNVTAQTRLPLQSGTYVVLCPMRSDRARAPDYELGVMATFKVS
jgi:hypothetical protein